MAAMQARFFAIIFLAFALALAALAIFVGSCSEKGVRSTTLLSFLSPPSPSFVRLDREHRRHVVE